MAKKQVRERRIDLPKGMSKPSLRALDTIGVTRLEQLQGFSEQEIASLHGMGPKGLGLLEDALREAGLTFARSEGAAGGRS